MVNEALRAEGVHILIGPGGIEPHPPHTGGDLIDSYPWHLALDEAERLPSGLVDDVLASTGAVQKRMRALPSRAGMSFVLAMTLFPGIGYLKVWDKMTGAPEDLGLPRPAEKAWRDLRRRIGPAPAKALSETVAVPLASPRAPGVACRGMRTAASGGLNSVKVCPAATGTGPGRGRR